MKTTIRTGLGIFLLMLLWSTGLRAQEAEKFGFIKVRKQSDDSLTASATPDATELEAPGVDQRNRAEDDDRIWPAAVTAPVLTKGEIGLMLVAPYVDKVIAKQGSYVLFDFTVDQNGVVSNVIIHESSDPAFRQTVLRFLFDSEWRSSKDSEGRTTIYEFKNQIAKRRMN